MQRQLLALVRLTFVDPRKMVDMLRVYAPGTNVLFQLAVIVVSFGVIINWVSVQLHPSDVTSFIDDLSANPILFAIIQLMALMISAILIFVLGRFFGGFASFEQSFSVSIWLSFCSVVVMVPIVLVSLVSTTLAGLINLGVSFYIVWLFVVFIQHIHGFSSPWKTAAGLVLTFFAIVFIMSFIMVFIGLTVEGP